VHRKMCMTAQFFVHNAVGSRFLIIIQVGKIWMQTISKARCLSKWRIDFLNLLCARSARKFPITSDVPHYSRTLSPSLHVAFW
jgi:hypothetical protein